MASIREMFHEIGNCYNKMSMCTGLTKELTDQCLKEKNPKDLKVKLAMVSKNLTRITRNIKEADKKFRRLHDRVYKIINPDLDKPR